MSSIIHLRDLHYTYPDGREALRGLSLDVQRHESVALLGPNGAGKSTVLLHLNGLLQGRGEIEVCGLPVRKGNFHVLRQKVGLAFQNPEDQLFMPTVLEDVAFGPMNAGLEQGEVLERCHRALESVGLVGFEERPTHGLSLGEKKRVALATVLVMDCEVLALDEPTSGLDPRGKGEIFTLLQSLPVTRLIATHHLDLAAALCDRCVILDEGRVVAHGESSLVLEDHALLRKHGLLPP
ncbi:MAG: ABC transporter ATP-binding protein [Armatimonadetes bacterium]|nr:ABC transporter ATP-binding protein [Armatimonadota bacterium]